MWRKMLGGGGKKYHATWERGSGVKEEAYKCFTVDMESSHAMMIQSVYAWPYLQVKIVYFVM